MQAEMCVAVALLLLAINGVCCANTAGIGSGGGAETPSPTPSNSSSHLMSTVYALGAGCAVFSLTTVLLSLCVCGLCIKLRRLYAVGVHNMHKRGRTSSTATAEVDKYGYWITDVKTADTEVKVAFNDPLPVTTTFQEDDTNKSIPKDEITAVSEQQNDTPSLTASLKNRRRSSAASAAVEVHHPPVIEVPEPVLEKPSSPTHESKLKPIPVPSVPPIPQPIVVTKCSPPPEQAMETTIAVESKLLHATMPFEASFSDELMKGLTTQTDTSFAEQVMLDLEELPSRPISTHLYENSSAWVDSLLASKADMRGRALPEIPDQKFLTLPSSLYPTRPSPYIKPCKEINFLDMDPNNDYVPMTPCTRSQSFKSQLIGNRHPSFD